MNPPNFRFFLLRFTSVLILFTIFDFCAGPALGVDRAITLGQWIAIPALFIMWLGSVLAWGRLTLQRLGPKEPGAGLALATGSLLFAMIAFLLAAAGLLQPGVRYLLFIFQALGLALVSVRKVRTKVSAALAFLPLGALFALYALDSLPIHSYWDPLHHHLVGARQFWEAGRIYFPPDSIASFQEGGFELLFLWPHFYFAKAEGLGLLPVQIFGQLTHSVLGFGGSLLLAGSLASRWLPHPAWRALALMLFAMPASLHFAIPTAKNDWGIVLWLLAGFSLLCPPAKDERGGKGVKQYALLSLAGFLWGFSFLAKLSSVFAITGLATILLFRRPSARGLASVAIGFALGALPLALRNWIGAGNPVFPLLADFFPGTMMGPSWTEALATYQASPALLTRVKELAEEFPLAPLAFLLPLLSVVRNNGPELRAGSAAVTLGFLCFSLVAGKATELRLLGALLPLAGLLTGVIVFKVVSRIPFRVKSLPWVLLALLALALPYRWGAFARLKSLPHSHELTRAYVSGEAQGWFRDHFEPGMRAALLVETRTYHSQPYPLVRIWDSARLDARLRKATSAEGFLALLRAEGFTHLILSQEKLDLFYPRELVGQVEAYMLAREETFVFQSPFSIVADLRKLK
jgi:hypothetical protein